jgi:glycosyltransferase involved in cell wall biosynthesis
MDLAHYPTTTRLTLRVLAFCSRAPQVVIVNSQVGQQFHQAVGYQARRWEVIPNGFDMLRFRPNASARQWVCEEFGVQTDAVLVGLVARVDPMKDHDTFLDAAGLVAKARTTVRFLLVGRDTQTLKSAVDQRGLTDYVHLLGERGDVDRLLPGIDIACLSSISEGFPNVLGEAMACGIPCVSTNVGDARSIIGDTGLVVPMRDPVAMARAIMDLIDRGHAAREQLGRAARARIESEYSLPKIVDRYTALYSELSLNDSLGH